ncbi:hypothetical protein FHT86_006392 [Rhizobium sp. BK313]|nr:hypothetical protein [Rhizobium sp. BK313]MBB3458067.1 hypothetical protein [Rhizobium sp. BK313]
MTSMFEQRLRLVPEASGIDRMMAAETFADAIGLLARSFIASHVAAPRPSALFASQQRWLLSQAALTRHFRAARIGGPGVSRRVVGHLAVQHNIASRNTAYAFFDEILKYGLVLPAPEESRVGDVVPAPEAMSVLCLWYEVHLAALDCIDGGDRGSRFRSAPERLLPLLAPAIGDRLLASPEIRMPGPLYRIFAWTDAGGHLMDRLVAGIDRHASQLGGYLTDVRSISHLADFLALSRAHTSRKLTEAESIGGLGWNGRRGRSRIWISDGFYREYAMAQARKLIIFHEAFAEIEGQPSKREDEDCAVL